jgi:hypothetical protein
MKTRHLFLKSTINTLFAIALLALVLPVFAPPPEGKGGGKTKDDPPPVFNDQTVAFGYLWGLN